MTWFNPTLLRVAFPRTALIRTIADINFRSCRMSKFFCLPLLFMIAAGALTACAAPPGERNGPPGGAGYSGGAASCQSVTRPQGERLRETMLALELTPRQQVLWDVYQESVSALMADQMRPEKTAIRKGALQQINARVDTVRNRLAAMEEIADKANVLYQSLDEKQKKTADERLVSTVPALYSGLACQFESKGDRREDRSGDSRGRGGRGGPDGGAGGGRF
jgi:hypothetical protein